MFAKLRACSQCPSCMVTRPVYQAGLSTITSTTIESQPVPPAVTACCYLPSAVRKAPHARYQALSLNLCDSPEQSTTSRTISKSCGTYSGICIRMLVEAAGKASSTGKRHPAQSCVASYERIGDRPHLWVEILDANQEQPGLQTTVVRSVCLAHNHVNSHPWRCEPSVRIRVHQTTARDGFQKLSQILKV